MKSIHANLLFHMFLIHDSTSTTNSIKILSSLIAVQMIESVCIWCCTHVYIGNWTSQWKWWQSWPIGKWMKCQVASLVYVFFVIQIASAFLLDSVSMTNFDLCQQGDYKRHRLDDIFSVAAFWWIRPLELFIVYIYEERKRKKKEPTEWRENQQKNFPS